MKFREPELEQYKQIWLTREAHSILKEEKKRLKKLGKGRSMARINNDLIINGKINLKELKEKRYERKNTLHYKHNL